jgi:diacylglycerol kinase
MIQPRKLIKSFGHAFEGLEHAYKYDQNLRIHFFVGTLVVLASIVLKVNPFEMGILGVMILLVMVTEMINSAIERMVDLITKEHREDAKIAKDVAAGMVFLTATGSLIVGILIFLPHVLKLFR